MFCKAKHLLLQIKHWWTKQLLEMNRETFEMCTWPSEGSAVIYNNFFLFNLYSPEKKISLFGHTSSPMPGVRSPVSANSKTIKHNFMWKNKLSTTYMPDPWFVGYRAAVVSFLTMGGTRKRGRILLVKYSFVRSKIGVVYFLFAAAGNTTEMF